MAKIFNAEEFEKEVLAADVAFVDFYADWCGPCQAMGPVIDSLAKTYEGKAVIGKVNVDQFPEIAKRYRVMSIPNMIVFKKGEIAKQFIGLTPEPEIEAAINAAL
ncbi:MAG: thioredoxin [Eubacteriales bacterium]|nr:thioredoxin [Eubacteriales bacterium]